MPTFSALNKFLDQDTTPSRNLQRDMVDVMKKFTEIATKDRLRFGFSNIPQKVAPVEFVFTGRSLLPRGSRGSFHIHYINSPIA